MEEDRLMPWGSFVKPRKVLPGVSPLELADALGTTRAIVIAAIRRGELKATRHGRVWRIATLDAAKFMYRSVGPLAKLLG